MKNLYLYIVISLFLHSSCSNFTGEKDVIINYICNKEHNLSQIDSINGITYKVQFKPYSLIAIKDINNKGSNIDSLQRMVDEPQAFHFNLSLSRNDQDLFYSVRQEFNFNELADKLSFHLDNFIYCIYDNRDTIKISSFLFIKEYGSSNSSNAIITCKAKNHFDQLTLLIKDVVFDSKQDMKMTFKNSDFKKVPNINLKEYYEKRVQS